MLIKIISLLFIFNLSFSFADGIKIFDRNYSNTQSLSAEIFTHQGIIKIELFFNEAPQTVANFESLVKSGFYNGIIFHRVIQGFMIQTGDPTGTGRGGPGYSIKDEINELTHSRGMLSMANTGQANSGGSQFFITQKDQKQLDGKHTIFGKVIKGESFIYLIEQGDPILSVRIIETQKKTTEGKVNGNH